MSTYFIGDIHGCYNSLKNILKKAKFNPKKDIVWFTGDLVSKGPYSLEVLDLIYNIKNSVKIVLGNHDLNLLKVYSNINNYVEKKYINNTNITQSSHSKKLINWLRYQPIMQIDEEKKIIMTHAGIDPTWDMPTAKKFAKEIENILRSEHYATILYHTDNINKITNHTTNTIIKNFTNIQNNINTFTRMRYILPNGQLDMEYKDIPEKTPNSLTPWFNIPGPISSNYNIIFGHWSTLQGKGTPPGIYGLDSGCYRGGKLTLLQWENKKFIQVHCNHHKL